MTATAARYRPPYVSQILRDPDGVYTDCAAESGIMLAACWTLGEWTRRPDGSMRSLLELSEVLRKRIGDTVGGLTLHDVNDLLHELDPGLPDLPRYPGQSAKPGQSTAGADLRLTWPQVIERLRNGCAVILLGYLPSGVGHAIFVYRGKEKTATRLDPFTRHGLDWSGEDVPYAELREFTERRIKGERYGSEAAVACAVVEIGSETMAVRVSRDLGQKLTLRARALDSAKRALEEAAARIKELEARPPADCAAIIAERDAALAAKATAEAALNEETDRAVAAETVIETVRRAVAA